MKRAPNAAVAIAAVVGVATVIAVATGTVIGKMRPSTKAPVTVRGVIGSEKAPFFGDPKVQQVFARHGFKVDVEPAGSRQMATEMDLARYDFVFPSSAPAAEKVQRERHLTRGYAPFYSPMAIATFTPVVEVLARAGMARKAPDGVWTLDVKAYLDAVGKGLRWNQIPGNSAYPAPQAVLVTTTHPRDSNSAAMYAAVTSAVANGGTPVRGEAELAKLAETVAKPFVDQGYLERSTEGPFENYLATGLNYKPMVWVYEAQYLGRAIDKRGAVGANTALLYPSPTVLSKHTLVPLTDNGDAVGRLLSTDPELAGHAARYGFRTADPAHFAKALSAAGLPAPPTLVDVVDPPAYEVLEAMLDGIAKRYEVKQ